MGITIRPVAADDLPQLLALCRDHAAYERLNWRDEGQAAWLAQALFDTPPRLFAWVLADDTGTLHGYMSATLDFSTWQAAPFVYMDCLYLAEAQRGQGWGRRLMRQLQQFAHQQGCTQIQWQTPPDNQGGIAFYQRIGAQALPKQRYTLTQGEGSWA
jgi:ribosomal protein S18 acetylase RimI-like enzyme